MTRTILALAAAAVAVSATPAVARHHHVTVYRVGYSFGPDYTYTDYTALPQPIVTRYHLSSDYRYVNTNGYVYVVSPKTYRVVRVIRVPA